MILSDSTIRGFFGAGYDLPPASYDVTLGNRFLIPEKDIYTKTLGIGDVRYREVESGSVKMDSGAFLLAETVETQGRFESEVLRTYNLNRGDFHP